MSMKEIMLVIRQWMPDVKLRCRSIGQQSCVRERPISISELIISSTCIEIRMTLAHGPITLRCQ